MRPLFQTPRYAALNSECADRLPQRRVHKGVQVASFKLFANLALYLQSPSLRPRNGNLVDWEGEWNSTALASALSSPRVYQQPALSGAKVGETGFPLLQEVTCPQLLCRLVSSAAGLGIPLNHLMHLVVLRVEKEPEMFHLEHILSIARYASE